MPIYMDRHDLSGATAKDVAQAHQQDLSIQDDYGCKGLTYWFDEERGAAFCLVEAPDMESVKSMHDHAHGLVPHQIIEVESKVVEAFLGRIHDPQIETNIDESGLLLLNDPAFRAIMAIEIDESELINYRINKSVTQNNYDAYYKIIVDTLDQFEGRKVEHVKNGFLVSFSSVANANCCALEINSKLQSNESKLKVKIAPKIGISAGVPVTEDEAFFGDTIEQAKRLCEIASTGQILVSSSLKEYLHADHIKQLNEQPSIKIISSDEEEFLKQLITVTNTLWNNPDFSINLFNSKMGLSKSQLYRKTVSLTKLSPSDFVKEYKLKMSLRLLSESKGNISEIAYDLGYSSPSYFSKCFYKRYGISPSEFLSSKEK